VPNLQLILDYANLFCGSGVPDDRTSNHLVLSELTLPTMEIQYVDHRAGGAPVAIEIDVVMTRMEMSFEVVGITPQIMVLLRNLELSKHDFFAYGNLRDYTFSGCYQLYAYFHGQLSRVEPRPFRRGDVFHTKYQVRGLTRYALYIGNNEVPIYNWDFFNNEFQTGKLIGG
jgi:phage tail tube protein FII